MTTSVRETGIHAGSHKIVGWLGGFGQTRGSALITLVVANALWAGTYAAGKIALHDLNPVELNALRFLIASIALAPALVHGWRSIPHDRRSLGTLATLTLLGFVMNKAFEYFGLSLSTASDVALLISTESLFTAVLSWTLLRERVTAAGVAALGVGMAGVYLIVERGVVPTLGGPAGSGRIIGDLLVIFSLLLESGYTILGKRTLTQMPPLLFTAATLVGSLFVWIPAGVVSVARLGMPHLSLAGWVSVFYMALVATVLGYWLWFRALAVVDASTAAPTLFIQPLLGAALGVWLLHDSVTWATWLGGGLIFASLLLVMRHERPRRTRPDLGETLVELGESAP
ncbi:MAG TPA: DMT family transporter [Ktedonobacterales bacterium]|jgi:drug/metabolite transporter (DMT)-like permease|nr:DMT family transporter [Ktedonobacterales bacterium]